MLLIKERARQAKPPQAEPTLQYRGGGRADARSSKTLNGGELERGGGQRKPAKDGGKAPEPPIRGAAVLPR